jgi:PAS domain S-box-containing protein
MQALPRPSTTLTISVILAILVVFFGDIITPLGYAEVILYLVPLLLSSFLYEPQLPIRIAGVTTVLAAAGFLLSPPGAPAVYAMLNRTMAVLVLWTVAFGLRRLIRDRQTHLNEEQRWQLLAHQTNDILWDWDLRTNAHWWSNNAIDTFGYVPMQEPSIVAWHSRLHPDDRARVQVSLQAAIDHGQPGWSGEYRFRMNDGSYGTFLDRGRIIRNDSGAAIRMIGAMMDVTERHQTQEALQQSEQRYGNLVHNLDSIVWEAEAGSLAFTFVSPYAETLLGYPISQWLEDPAFWPHHIHPDDRDTTVQACLAATAKGLTHSSDYRMITAAGHVVWVHDVVTVTCENGAPKRVQGVMVDITARKQTEQALQDTQQRLAQSLQASNTGLWEWNTVTNNAYFSAQWKRQLGYRDEEIGNTFSEWESRLHLEDHDRALAYARQYLASPSEYYSQEFRLRHKDGSYRWIAASASFLQEPDGRTIRLLGSHTDITRLKEAKAALIASHQAIRELYEVTLASQEPFQRQVEALLDLGRRRFDLPLGILTRTVGDEAELSVVRTSGIELSPGTRIPVAGSPCAHTLTQRDPLQIDRLSASKFCHHLVHAGLRMECYLGVRIMVGALPYGTLCFLGPAQRVTPFSEAETTFLQLMARWVSSALEREQTAEALRESEERKSAILNAALDAIITIDQHEHIIEFNPAAEATFNYRREDILGKSIGDLIIPPGLRAQHRRGMAHYLATGNGPLLDRRIEITAMRADGSEFPIELSLARISAKSPALFTAFIRDITEQKRAAESLSQSEARLTEAQRIAGIGSWEWDMAMEVTWSDESYRIFGYVPQSIVPSYDVFIESLHVDDRERVKHALQAIMRDHAPYDVICRIIRPSGEIRHIRCRGEARRNGTGTLLRVAGTVEDVTERIQTEAQLRNAYAHLQDLTRRAAKAEENERRRIAREIHDELGQLVTAMRFQLTSLKKDLAAKSPLPDTANRTARLNDLLELSNTMLNQVRHVSASLRPAMLDELGLIPAVQAHAQQFEVRTGIACDVVIDPALAERTFDDATSSSVFRVVQELLTNILKHAQAMAVTITCAEDGGMLRVTVQDNGTGGIPHEEARQDSFGLRGISERAALLGGTFSIGPNQDDGTIATLRVPLVVLSPAPLLTPLSRPDSEDHEDSLSR